MMDLETAKETPFAWPGGYPIYAVMNDGARLCYHCLTTETEVHEGGDADGWRFEGAEVFWEGPTDACGHCGTELESAYGDTNEREE